MVLTVEDLVMYKDENENHTAGGYNLKSCISNENNKEGTQRGGTSILLTKLNDLAVPAALLVLQQNIPKNYQVSNNNKVVPDVLYDELLNRAVVMDKNEKKLTRKKKIKNLKVTKRNKITTKN